MRDALTYIAEGSPWKDKLSADSIVLEYEEVAKAALRAGSGDSEADRLLADMRRVREATTTPAGSGDSETHAALVRLVDRVETYRETRSYLASFKLRCAVNAAKQVIASEPSSMAGSGDSEPGMTFQWLIERGQPEELTNPVWLEHSAWQPASHQAWTRNAWDAAMFPDRATAERYIADERLKARAVEHGFANRPAAPASPHDETLRAVVDAAGLTIREWDTSPLTKNLFSPALETLREELAALAARSGSTEEGDAA